jgi:hypothetical protein
VYGRYAVFHFWKIFQAVEVWIVVKLLFEIFESFVFLFEFFYKVNATFFQVLHIFFEVFDFFLVRPVFLQEIFIFWDVYGKFRVLDKYLRCCRPIEVCLRYRNLFCTTDMQAWILLTLKGTHCETCDRISC